VSWALTTEVADSPAGGAASRGPRAGGCGDLGPLLSRMPLSGTLGNYPSATRPSGERRVGSTLRC